MARTDPQTNLRLPADLKDRLMEAARSANRTFGAEVVMRLENSFRLEATKSDLDQMLEMSQHNAQRVDEGLKELKTLKAALEAQIEEAKAVLGPGSK